MPLNAALVGKTYPAQSFALDAARVAAFAEVVGQPGERVPPTFVTGAEQATVAEVIGDEELSLDYSRVVHGEESYEWGRALAVGEILTAEATIENIRSKGGLELLTVRTELRDEAGRVVVVCRSILIVRALV
ncbi:MAG: FAS1-like dehydratase domain-containing protein [Actinomycetota bacterium]